MLYEIEQQIKEGKEPFKQQLAALERDRDLAKEAVKKAVESAVESARDPFAKLSLSDYKQQLDSAFVAFDFATDRFRSQEQVYLSALEGGTKYFSPEANSEYARVDRFQRSPGGEVRLKPSLAADWMLLKREQISETYYKARQDLQAEREVFDSYFASRLEHLFLTIVSQVEAKRAQFRRKLVDIERIRSEVNSLASESGRELKLELDSKGRPTFFFSEEELS